jgi:hypothetical protein
MTNRTNYPIVNMLTSSDALSISRVLGFIQTDGNISYGFDVKDRVFRPKIGITASLQNKGILTDYIAPFLRSHGITTNFQIRTQNSGSTMNLNIERQKSVEKFISLIENNKLGSCVLLVDDKLFGYNALKKAIQLNKFKNASLDSFEKAAFFKQMIDLKMFVLKINNQKRDGYLSVADGEKIKLSRQKLEEKCRVVNSKGAAKQLISDLTLETNNQCEELLEYLKNENIHCLNAPQNLKDYIFSTLEGDGSYQVGFATKRSGNKEKPRKFKEFSLSITLTDGCVTTNRHYLLEIVQLFFQSQSKFYANPFKNTDRLYIKAHKNMENILLFVKSIGFINESHAKRFTFFEYCFVNYKQIHKNRELALFLLNKLEDYGDLRYFKYSKEERVVIINDYFDSLESL